MDWPSVLNALVGAGGPIIAGAWLLTLRVDRIGASVDRLRTDVDRAIQALDDAERQVGAIRERLAVLEAGCARCQAFTPSSKA